MKPIRTFEDIEAWKSARRLANNIYDVSSLGEFGRDFALKNQIRRAVVSIISNIAEGYERGWRQGIHSVPLCSKRFLR